MKKDGYTVYMHKNKIDGKVYIGITSQPPKQRWRNGTNYYGNEHFNRAIHKYGWDNFEHIILYSNLSKIDAENKEIELIKQYDSTNQKKGYNIEFGGNTKGKHSKETIKKISESQKGELNHMYGKTGILNAQSKKIIRLNDRKLFNSMSEVFDFARNVSGACNGKIAYSGKFENGEEMIWMYYDTYIQMSEYEILLYISEKQKLILKRKPKQRQTKGMYTVPLMCLNSTMVFKSLKEASEYYNISTSIISSQINGNCNVFRIKDTGESLIFKEIDMDEYNKNVQYNFTKENIHINFTSGTCIEIFKDGTSYGVSSSINDLVDNCFLYLGVKLEITGVRYQMNKSKKDYKGYTFKPIDKIEYLKRIGIL